jgi:hypothetical protein
MNPSRAIATRRQIAPTISASADDQREVSGGLAGCDRTDPGRGEDGRAGFRAHAEVA